MGIDRIGKGGSAPPPGATPGASGAQKTGRPFEAEKPGAKPAAEHASSAAQAGQVHAAGASPLEQLKAGKIDMDGYLDQKVQEATVHLRGVTPAQLDDIRTLLRDRMATDPTLADLVKQATGEAPRIPDDDG